MSCLTGKSFNPVMNRRSVIAGVAGLGAASILAGCSDSGSGSGSGASGDAADFKIGSMGPLTGPAASYGVSVCGGAELACKDFSTDELPLSFKSEDDVADGEKAVNAFNSLADWGMQVLVGPTTTGCSLTVAQAAEDAHLFMITPSATAPDVTADKTVVYRACYNDPALGVNSAKWLAENFANEKFAVFYNAGDTYSSGVRDAFMDEAEALKLQIVDEETFKDDSATSFTNQLTKAKDKGATMIFAPIYYTPASVLLTNAKDMGYDVKMMGCDGMDGILGVEGFDATMAEGLYLLTPFSADDPKNADFVKEYQDKFGELPDQFAADAYDSVHAVALAAAEAGLTADSDPSEVADKLPEAMTKIKVDGLTGVLTWNDKGEVEKDVTVYVIEDGKYVQA